MKRLLIGTALVAGALLVGGCGFIFVARSQPRTPGYCYDCHYDPHWRAVYTRCGHYEIRVVRDGYYYRPHRHAGHDEFTFVKYDHARDKQSAKNDDRAERDKKSRR